MVNETETETVLSALTTSPALACSQDDSFTIVSTTVLSLSLSLSLSRLS